MMCGFGVRFSLIVTDNMLVSSVTKYGVLKMRILTTKSLLLIACLFLMLCPVLALAQEVSDCLVSSNVDGSTTYQCGQKQSYYSSTRAAKMDIMHAQNKTVLFKGEFWAIVNRGSSVVMWLFDSDNSSWDVYFDPSLNTIVGDFHRHQSITIICTIKSMNDMRSCYLNQILEK